MSSIVCINCGHSVPDKNFCNECGATLKCRECKSPLNKDDKFCGECGTAINSLQASNIAPNTFDFYKKGDEISYKVGLSNEVGKEGIKSLIESIAQSNMTTTIDIPATEIETRKIEGSPPVKNIQTPTGENTNSNSGGANDVATVEKTGETSVTYPHIDDLLHRRKYTEMEWILVFAFIESGFGEHTFTKEKVKDAYLGKRKNDSRVKNFSGNWTGLQKTFFETASEGIFRIDFEKHQSVSDFVLGKVNGIIKGAYENKTPSEKKVVKEKVEVNTKSKSSKNITPEDFDTLKNNTKPSLQELYDKFKPSLNKDIFGLIAYYVCSINGSEQFSAGNIDYAYRILKLPRKNHLIQLVNNVKNETQWFEGVESGIWKLNRLGNVQLEEMFRLN